MSTINIYEYPTDSTLLPAYRIAVMQAALEGKDIECWGNGDSWYEVTNPCWNWSNYRFRIAQPKPRYFRNRNGLFCGFESSADPVFHVPYAVTLTGDTVGFVNIDGLQAPQTSQGWTKDSILGTVERGGWVEFDGNMEPFRPKPVIAEGFNPAGLTVEQIGAGYRTLSVEEAEYLQSLSASKVQPGLELFSNYSQKWKDNAAGDSVSLTYRTTNPPGFYLPKPVIAQGYNPLKLTEEQVGVKDGWRLLTQEEHDAARRVPDCEYWSRPLWKERPGCLTKSEALRTKRPAGYFLPKPPKQPETVMEWLLTLPKEYRVLAIRNMNETTKDVRRLDLPSAISTAFVWGGSPEGHGFWESVRTSLEQGTPLPPIPTPESAPKKLIPWTLETMVWPDCVRSKDNHTKVYGVQLADSNGLVLGVRPEGCAIYITTWQRLYDESEYSIDHGQTWLPCGSLEEAKKN